MKWPFIIAAIIATLLFGSSLPLMIILILGIIKKFIPEERESLYIDTYLSRLFYLNKYVGEIGKGT